MKGAIAAKTGRNMAERDGFYLCNLSTKLTQKFTKEQQELKFQLVFGADGLDAFVAGVGTGELLLVFHALKAVQTFKFLQLRQTNQLSYQVKTWTS